MVRPLTLASMMTLALGLAACSYMGYPSDTTESAAPPAASEPTPLGNAEPGTPHPETHGSIQPRTPPLSNQQ